MVLGRAPGKAEVGDQPRLKAYVDSSPPKMRVLLPLSVQARASDEA